MLEANHSLSWKTSRWRHRVEGSEGVLLTSALIVGLLTLIAAVSLATQTDPHLTTVRRTLGFAIVLSTAATFLIVQKSLVSGHQSRVLVQASWVLITLGVVNIWLSFSWTMLGISMATTVLVMQHNPWRYVAAGAVLLLGVAALFLEQSTLVAQLGVPTVSLLVAFVLYTLTRLIQTLTALRLSQEEIARLRVDDERERISRDLHDLIGRTLVATSLRQQAALHLIDRDHDKARAQLEKAHEAVADGQAQLRKLTRGPMSIDLAHELASTRALCQRLGIEFRQSIDHPLPPLVDRWAARILREATTNMLKHSQPQRCQLVVAMDSHGAIITMENDGCPPGPSGKGTGIIHLRDQLEALGGRLSADPVGNGRYLLESRLPQPGE